MNEYLVNLKKKFSFIDKKYLIILTFVYALIPWILDLFLYIFFKTPIELNYKLIILRMTFAFILSLIVNYSFYWLPNNYDRIVKFYKSKYFKAFVLLTPIYLTLAFIHYGFNIGDVDSARYMISTIIQSEAAIIAIIISLSLVAIQLSSSSYSIRLIDIFKKSPSLWILISAYIIIIIYGLIILGIINQNNVHYFDNQIIIIFYLAIFLFGSLIPYIIDVIDLLKPSTVINKLKYNIKEKNIIDAIKKDNSLDVEIVPITGFFTSLDIHNIKPVIQSDKEPLQPIIDIIKSSIIQNDMKTFKDGLNAVRYTNRILENNKIEDRDKETIIKLLLTYLGRIGKLLIDKGDKEALYELITPVVSYGIKSRKKNFSQALILTIDTLGSLGIYALDKNQEYIASYCAYSIRYICKDIKDGVFKNVLESALLYLKKIGKEALRKEYDDTLLMVILSLAVINNTQNGFNRIKIDIMDFLGELGMSSAKLGLEDATNYSSMVIINLAKEVKTDDREHFNKIIYYLLEMSYGAINEKFTTGAIISVFSLQNSCELAIINGFEFEAIQIGKFIMELTKKVIDNKFDDLYDIPGFLEDSIRFAIFHYYDTIKLVEEIISSPAKRSFIMDLKKYERYNNLRVINKLINSLGDIGESIANNNPYCYTRQIIKHFIVIQELGLNLNIGPSIVSNLSKIGLIVIDKGAKENAQIIIKSIKLSIKSDISNKVNIKPYNLENVVKIATIAMKKDNDTKEYAEIYKDIINSFTDFSQQMIKEKDNNVGLFLFSLGDIGETAAQLRNLEILNIILDSLKDGGKKSVKLGLSNGIKGVSYSFEVIGKETAEQGFEKISIECINFFIEHEKTIIFEENYSALEYAVKSFGDIGKIAVKKKFIDLSNICIEYSEQLGKSLIDKISHDKKIGQESIEEIHNLSNLLDYFIIIAKNANKISDSETMSKIDATLIELANYANINNLNILEKRIWKYNQEFKYISA